MQITLGVLLVSAVGLILFDRPTSPPDARTQVDRDFRETITVGMARQSDFHNVDMRPTLDFQRFELGGWAVRFTASIEEKKGKRAGPGTIVIKVPKSATDIFPIYYDVTNMRNNQVAEGDAPFIEFSELK